MKTQPINQKRDVTFNVRSRRELRDGSFIWILSPQDSELPEVQPGQFVEILVPGGEVFLRRPISICDADVKAQTLTLWIAPKGKGTQRLGLVNEGSDVRILLPLGKGFSLPNKAAYPLLIGGGVGVAPLLYMCRKMVEIGLTKPVVLVGARSASQLEPVSLFEPFARVYISTEDGTIGERGPVTTHSILTEKAFTHIYTCGPKPMMSAVARYARSIGAECEVSLENTMACGLGACLCCVEDTITGNRCVCTEGPVFNLNELKW